MLKIGYRIIKNNLKFGFSSTVPILIAFLVLISTMSAIEYTSGNLTIDAIEHKPDFVIKSTNFEELIQGNEIVDNINNFDFVNRGQLFYYSYINFLAKETNNTKHSFEEFGGLNVYVIPEPTQQKYHLSLPKDSFYASEGLAKHFNISQGDYYPFNVYSLSLAYSNQTTTSYDITYLFNLDLSLAGILGVSVPSLDGILDLGDYSPRNPSEYAFSFGSSSYRLPEYTIVISTETLLNHPWLYHYTNTAFFTVDFKEEAFSTFTDIKQAISETMNMSYQLADVFLYDDSFQLYGAFSFYYLLKERLLLIEKQVSDVFETYSWPIIIILTFPLFVSFNVVQKQISDNRKLIETLYSRGATRFQVGFTLFIICLIINFLMFGVMIAFDSFIVTPFISQGLTQNFSALSFAIFLIVFTSSIQLSAIWNELMRKVSNYSLSFEKENVYSKSEKLIIIGIILSSASLLYLLTTVRYHIPFTGNIDQVSIILLLLIITIPPFFVWKLTLKAIIWSLTMVLKIKYGEASSLILRGISKNLKKTRHLLFLSFLISTTLSLVFAYYDAKDQHYYSLYDEQFGGDVMVGGLDIYWERITQIQGVTDFSEIHSVFVQSRTGINMRMLIIDAEKHEEMIHSRGKYNVYGETEELFSSLTSNPLGILMSAEIASSYSYDVDDTFDLSNSYTSEYIPVSIQGIFTRFLPTAESMVDLVIDKGMLEHLDVLNQVIGYPDFIMLELEDGVKDQVVQQINIVSPGVNLFYFGDDRYERYNQKPSVKTKGFMYCVFSLTGLIGSIAILSSSIIRAKEEQLKMMKIMDSIGFSARSYGQIFLIAYSVASIAYYSIGLLVGNLIFGILIRFFDQFRRAEFPMFGTDYQTFPQPIFVISDLTILWLVIMVNVLILWSIVNFLYHSVKSLKSKEYLNVAIYY